MRLCRFRPSPNAAPRVGLIVDPTPTPTAVLDLSAAGILNLSGLLELPNLRGLLCSLLGLGLPRYLWPTIELLAPVDRQEVWAAGVTYLRSREARQEESDFSAQAYARVYEAPRPELFFKSLAEKVSGPGRLVGIRSDSRWSVPEPELALVLNSRGEVAGCTLGNDMSARDIEGENLLYLPQAKIYAHSCSLGPWVAVGVEESVVKSWGVRLEIQRGEATVFQGETRFDRIKRSFGELAAHLFRCQEFPQGAVLLTGTGIVPPAAFTLQAGDRVFIRCPELGCLENGVSVV